MGVEMLSARSETILKSIVGQYITRARPVPSQSILSDHELGVSAATIRNEMVNLEQEGYIIRPHHSAGSIPSDKGYRRYVESLSDIKLPLAEQRLVSHLFHQVEQELDRWLNLAATLVAQMVRSVVVVTIPRTEAFQFKHLELVSLQNSLALVILVLSGARVRQQLVSFEQTTPQTELTAIANKLKASYFGLTTSEILANGSGLSPEEQQITDCLVKIMETEDAREYEENFIDGWHFMLNQPEFAHNQKLLALMELVEQRKLLSSIIPPELAADRVQVIIGQENAASAIRDYSVVISRYGLPKQASGVIGVIGPTRMPYGHTIATIDYLSLVLSELIAKLYGREAPSGENDRAN